MKHKHVSHIRKKDGMIQTNKEHLEGAKSAAQIFGRKVGLDAFMVIAAKLHDMGKETEAFWEYLERAVGEKGSVRRGEVDHATAGAYYIFSKYHKGSKIERLSAEMLAMICAYHHGGLQDFVDMTCRSAFLERMGKKEEEFHYAETLKNYFAACYDEGELDWLFQKAAAEVNDALEKTNGIGMKEELACSLLTLIAYSCLIDADRLDTYCFEEAEDMTCHLKCDPPDWRGFICSLEDKLTTFKVEGEGTARKVAELRRKVSDQCLAFARNPKGIYRLTVPTGGGKTFSVFRFALSHAKEYGMDHIFYIAPFLTILDQNVGDIRDALGIKKDDQETLLEYHSNILRVLPEEEKEKERQLLIAERFEAPLIFTSFVQFLNSFFEKGTKSVRRLHQLANSILIFDEAQAVPYRCIHLFNAALSFLAEACGCTIILCTATQPELSKTTKPLISRNKGEMIENVDELFASLNRTNIVDARIPGGYTIKALGNFVWEKANLKKNGLVILNKKKQAEELYQDIVEKNNQMEEKDSFKVFHLSTHMCPQHRRKILDRICAGLDRSENVICISTQLIEAGIDISFDCVVRAVAGLDSIAQAAGRCNRHGKAGETEDVYLVNLAGEDLSRLPDLERGRKQTIRILDEFKDCADFFCDNLLSPKAIAAYFNYYYSGNSELMDFPVKGELSNVSIVTLLGANRRCVDHYNENNKLSLDLECHQAFRTAAENFEVIPGGMISVLTPYEKGKDLIADFNSSMDLKDLNQSLKKAQQYSVNLFQWEFEELERKGAIVSLCDGAVLELREAYYSVDTGVVLEGGKMDALFS